MTRTRPCRTKKSRRAMGVDANRAAAARGGTRRRRGPTGTGAGLGRSGGLRGCGGVAPLAPVLPPLSVDELLDLVGQLLLELVGPLRVELAVLHRLVDVALGRFDDGVDDVVDRLVVILCDL